MSHFLFHNNTASLNDLWYETHASVIKMVAMELGGADKIPEFARGLGKGINNIKHATNEIKHEIKTSKDKINKDSNVSVQVKSEIEKVKSEIDSVTDSVKRDL